jgi:hypothetical protein
MAHFKSHRPPKKHHKKPHRRVSKPTPVQEPNHESTGEEALYLRSLVDSGAMVVVVLTSGEQIRGYVRYYDRDCFSLGPADGGPKLFLRKTSVRYLYEE